MAKKRPTNTNPPNKPNKPAQFEWGGIVYRLTPTGHYNDEHGNFLRNGSGQKCVHPNRLGKTSVGNKGPWSDEKKAKMAGNKNAVGNKANSGVRKLSVMKLNQLAKEYFEEQDNKQRRVMDRKTGEHMIDVLPYPYTLAGLCQKLGVTRETFHVWRRDKGDTNPEMAFAAEKILEMIVNRTVESGLLGDYNPNFATAWLKNVDSDHFKDKREVETTNPMPPQFNFINIPPGTDPSKLLKEGANGFQGEIVDTEIVEETDGHKDDDNIQ